MRRPTRGVCAVCDMRSETSCPRAACARPWICRRRQSAASAPTFWRARAAVRVKSTELRVQSRQLYCWQRAKPRAPYSRPALLHPACLWCLPRCARRVPMMPSRCGLQNNTFLHSPAWLSAATPSCFHPMRGAQARWSLRRWRRSRRCAQQPRRTLVPSAKRILQRNRPETKRLAARLTSWTQPSSLRTVKRPRSRKMLRRSSCHPLIRPRGTLRGSVECVVALHARSHSPTHAHAATAEPQNGESCPPFTDARRTAPTSRAVLAQHGHAPTHPPGADPSRQCAQRTRRPGPGSKTVLQCSR
mmetsp:Transcript_2106/g.6254  ORF Transcript_2106/g.6254 Transcript_2106/m.6254 type:complete len:302 (+) Transcript_2106:591-1496(+)